MKKNNMLVYKISYGSFDHLSIVIQTPKNRKCQMIRGCTTSLEMVNLKLQENF